MYAVASINLPNYQDLADLTDAPKQEYCDRHGYTFFVLKENKYSDIMGFNKIGYVLDLLNQFPFYEWILFTECDATITNLTVPMEDKIDNNYHVIIPVDRLNLNAGNFLVRNTPEGRAYLQMIMDKESEYKDHNWAEQQVMIDTIDNYTDIVKIVEQRYMNSYIQAPYDYCDVRTDVLGNSGEWQAGDWILHMPGLHKPVRIDVTKQILNHITR
jgi:galactosyl transferase GMA12/MNN10 family